MALFTKKDNIISLVFLIVAVIYGYMALQMPYFGGGIIGAAFFPKILTVVLIVLCLAFLVLNCLTDKDVKTVNFHDFQLKQMLQPAAVVLIIAAYAYALFHFGFKIPTFIFFLSMMVLFGEKRGRYLILVPLVSTILFDLVFRVLFKLPFHELQIF